MCLASAPGSAAGDGYFGSLASVTYMRLTTFRRDGTPVATPVHVVVSGEAAYFRTWDVSGKAKRLRHTQRVEVGPSSMRGRPLGPSFPARARLLEGEAAERAARALAHKHPFLHGMLIPRYHRMRGWQTLHYELSRPEAGPPPAGGNGDLPAPRPGPGL